jgi:CRISPR system Cascade subunit CasE
MLISQIVFYPQKCCSLEDLQWAAGDNLYGQHQLMWTLFPGKERGSYSFLFHKLQTTTPGERPRGLTFIVISQDPPVSAESYWEILTKPYGPKLKVGDLYQFRLRANPTIARPNGRKNKKGKDVSSRHDVIMDRKKMEHSKSSSLTTAHLVQEEGLKWLQSRGHTNGFEVFENHTIVQGYQQHDLGKGKSDVSKSIRLSTVDFEGLIKVTDVEAFSRAVAKGIGPAKGFGCGLILIKKASGEIE